MNSDNTSLHSCFLTTTRRCRIWPRLGPERYEKWYCEQSFIRVHRRRYATQREPTAIYEENARRASAKRTNGNLRRECTKGVGKENQRQSTKRMHEGCQQGKQGSSVLDMLVSCKNKNPKLSTDFRGDWHAEDALDGVKVIKSVDWLLEDDMKVVYETSIMTGFTP
jgi:hypothetical protein